MIASDRDVTPKRAPIPSLLVAGALHHGLLSRRLRGEVGIVIESGEPREVMHFCLLCGYGANAVNPYLAFEAIQKLHADGFFPADVELEQLSDQYITAVKKGILKTMSKMGISTLRSYHSAQQFEAIGLNHEVIDAYFTGTASRIEGAGLDVIAREVLARHRAALSQPRAAGELELDHEGEYQFRLDGEKHLWNPETITRLQQAVINNDRGGIRPVRPRVQRADPQALHAAGAVRVRAGRAGAAGRGDAGRAKSASGSTPGRCRTARSARKPTKRWPSR